jgi:hypothetical protein
MPKDARLQARAPEGQYSEPQQQLDNTSLLVKIDRKRRVF